MDLKKIIGQNIKKRRQELGLSLDDLSKLIDIDKGYISKIERGIPNITAETLYKFATILKTDINYYFGESELFSEDKIKNNLDYIYQMLDLISKEELIKYATYLFEKK